MTRSTTPFALLLALLLALVLLPGCGFFFTEDVHRMERQSVCSSKK